VRELRAAPLSGDWRDVRGDNLELIAALAVNSPGFPVPRVGVAAGIQVSLVAAAVVAPAEPAEFTRDGLNWDRLGDAVVAAMERKVRRQVRMAALRERVGGDV
jgi:hypothetical protein